ncbi:hypothetical protein [Novosphingobium panipatense]|uniref:hypothetical protein n=1 Tax=Novosphingobium panipatense TaxID=428991 RepID=UPI00361134C6
MTNDTLGDVAVAFEPLPVTRSEKPLPGAPTTTKINGERVTFGPYDPLRTMAEEYARERG